jgi:4-hydroxythreonine-4-phosphate dehydrogenase
MSGMTNAQIPRVIITPGEPAGIGPDVTLQIAQMDWPAELIIVADANLLQTRAKQLSLPLHLAPVDFLQPAISHKASHLKIIPVPLKTACVPGKLEKENASYVVECLEIATDICLEKKAAALITGPVQKSILNEANISFVGHTEFLAARCNATQSLMLFVIDHLKVALATTHIPLVDVAKNITPERLTSLIRLLNRELQNKFSIAQPKILVSGLNPHAGENGHFGHEEINVIEPTIKKLRAENIDVIGPLPADTIFTKKYLQTADAILAMYHDQALPVIKYMGFERAVNVTLGLPIIRTSVDHGTALDLAGTTKADAGSMQAAIRLALELIKNHLPAA